MIVADEIVKRIKGLCNERGWTEYRLAKEANITQSTLSNFMHRNNNPSITTLQKICRAFDLSLSEFFKYFDTEKNDSLEQIYHHLSDENKEKLCNYAKYLLENQ